LSNIFWGKPEEYRKTTPRISITPAGASFIELPLVTMR